MNELKTTDNPLALLNDTEIREAVNALADALSAFSRLVTEWAAAAVRVINNWWATIKDCIVPAKWTHLARYARKKRTRQKYQRMISRRWTEVIREVVAT